MRAGSKGRLSLEQRREPAGTPTDEVLVPEVGQPAPAARVTFRVIDEGSWGSSVARGG